jgi:hypothetical protein
MERVAFLIEQTNQRIPCLLNPEDQDDSFTIERSSGVSREQEYAPSRTRLTDNPVVFRSRGDTRLNLKLLFDITLVDSRFTVKDVRDLTRPIWQLSEYTAAHDSTQSLPRVRFIWGQAWNIPVVVESVAERFERFTPYGVPQRSWMSLRLLRLTDEIPPTDLPSQYTPVDIPDFTSERLPGAGSPVVDPGWGVHQLLEGDTGGESLWQLAAQHYGDPSLWRLIARANNIDDPSNLPAGIILRIPPLDTLIKRFKATISKLIGF